MISLQKFHCYKLHFKVTINFKKEIIQKASCDFSLLRKTFKGSKFIILRFNIIAT